MSTRGAAAPGTGHMVSTPDRVELCVLPEEFTARCKCPVSPPPRYAREDRETNSHAAQGTLHGTELLCKGRPGI